jgi:hypothetical protein
MPWGEAADGILPLFDSAWAAGKHREGPQLKAPTMDVVEMTSRVFNMTAIYSDSEQRSLNANLAGNFYSPLWKPGRQSEESPGKMAFAHDLNALRRTSGTKTRSVALAGGTAPAL